MREYSPPSLPPRPPPRRLPPAPVPRTGAWGSTLRLPVRAFTLSTVLTGTVGFSSPSESLPVDKMHGQLPLFHFEWPLCQIHVLNLRRPRQVSEMTTDFYTASAHREDTWLMRIEGLRYRTESGVEVLVSKRVSN